MLYWLKNGKDLRPYVSSTYGGGTLSKQSLTVKKVDKNDAGNYTCKLENNFGNSEDVTELKVLSVHVYNPVQRNIRANDTITLQCLITGGNSVTWRRNNQIIDTTSRVGYSGGTVNTPSLTITNVTRYHSGNYTCETSYDLVYVISKETIHLLVKDIPLVYQSSAILQAFTGDAIQLTCVHESYPVTSAVFWIKDGEKLNVSDSKYNGSTIIEPSLTIVNTDQFDAGTYVCAVANDIGTGYSNKSLLIIKDLDETRGDLVPIVGGGVGALAAIAILIAIICVVFRRRQKSHPKRQIVTTNYRTGAEAVQFRLDTDEDEVSPSILTNPNPPKDDHISIKVPDLKEYIFKKQQNNKLEDEYKNIKYGVLHPTTTSQQKANLLKNRFKEIFSYDHTRVVLEPGHGKSSDYINASYVDGFKKEKCYIASQGPLTKTINDHWRMIWQNNTRKIIMLTNLVEGTKRKCERYWPEGGKPMTCGNLVLTLQAEKERAAYTTREIELEDKTSEEKRSISQYHFTAWPDHGTPDPLYLVLFHKHVRSDHTSTENNGPLLVHCSAGIGRTGTYIGLDALYEEGRDTGFVDVAKFVEKMRFSRMNMVQTAEQYVCLHYALLEAFTMKDTNVGKKEFGNIWREISEDKGPVNRRRLHEEFEMLKAKTSEQDKAEYAAAKSPDNLGKNRNESIVPSDKNRLFLVSYKKGRTDYINAVQAPSYTKFVGYLTTQLPLPDTMVDFWTMVGDHSSSTIVVFLNNPAEAELVYSTSKDSFVYGKYTLKMKRGEQEDLGVTSCTVFLSKKGDQSREIAMYLAVTEDLPGPQVMCKLVNRISSRVSRSNDPVTVVSGDGAKNCGLFCAFVNAVSSMTIDKTADIFQLARLLQLRRPEFFADFEEYCLCYEALNHYLVSSKVYENI
ncbi:receptor-type tyrosine-protein phosphatase alpha-like [Mytilus galloprovincialis]|uniref:receptor-type tyrosine-protein phosphatase alpha-like n=1 Tax=Mytilus galloprovincialis TaxID=29158 RepID=UPI003F7B49A3